MTIEDVEAKILRRDPLIGKGGEDCDVILTLDGGTKLLERSGPLSRSGVYEAIYESLKDLENLKEKGIPKPYFLTEKDDRAILITSYSEGTPLAEVLKGASAPTQEELGKKTGALLSAVHTLAPEHEPDDAVYDRRFKEAVSRYIDLGLYLPEEGAVIGFLLDHMKEVMRKRPFTYVHGNVSLATLLAGADGNVLFLDASDVGAFDPYYDFRLFESIHEKAPAFALSTIRSYANGNPSQDFWMAFALYSAVQLLTDSIRMVQSRQVKEAVARFHAVTSDFHGFEGDRLAPQWYEPIPEKEGSKPGTT